MAGPQCAAWSGRRPRPGRGGPTGRGPGRGSRRGPSSSGAGLNGGGGLVLCLGVEGGAESRRRLSWQPSAVSGGVPSREQLERYFVFDDADQALVARRPGDQKCPGFSVQLTSPASPAGADRLRGEAREGEHYLVALSSLSTPGWLDRALCRVALSTAVSAAESFEQGLNGRQVGEAVDEHLTVALELHLESVVHLVERRD